MLLDNNAVEQFSELYFDVSDADNGFGGKVIKEDGKVEQLDLNRAIAVEDVSEVPGIFRSYTQSGRKQFFKIPVSNLQPGDILDYAYLVNNDASVRDKFMEFQPVYYQCHRGYSIVKQQFDIKLDNQTFLNNRTMNGAPEFTEKSEGDFVTYTWVDRDREKLRDQSYVNEYLLLPMVKFQIVFSNRENAGNLFIGSRGEMKTKLSTEELGKKINNIYAGMNDGYGGQIVNQVKYHMKKMDALDVRDDDYIRNTYYILRHLSIMNDYEFSSARFASVFKAVMDAKKIPCNLLVTAPNNLTRPEDIIFRSEVEWFVQVKDKYIFNGDAMSNMYDVPPDVQGNDAFIITPGKTASVEKVTLPATTPADNTSETNITASLNIETENLLVSSNQEYKGNSRAAQVYAAMMYENYVPMDWRTYGGYDELEELPVARRDALSERIAKYKREAQRLKPKYMERQLKDEFNDVVKYTAFRMVQDGRNWKKTSLQYGEDFELGDRVRHAGKSILVAVPGLISNQLQIKNKERSRQYDIDVRYPRQYKWNISFAIPAGYTVYGLEDLQQNIDNATGSFVSTATIQNGTLMINTTKTYKQARISKDNWPDMLKWIDAAYNFGQKKILLRKG